MEILETLFGWFVLVLVLVGWIYYKYQLEPKNSVIVDFSLTQSVVFYEWQNEFLGKFKWFDVIRDDRVGKYRFKELVIEVTGRDMSAFEIRRTLERIAWSLGFLIKFDVVIKECADHDLIKVTYVIPEWAADYNKMLAIKARFKKEQELKKEQMRKPVGGFIKKEK